MTFLKPASAAALAGPVMLAETRRDPWNRRSAHAVMARTPATTPFPPTVHVASPPGGEASGMAPPPHSGAVAAPERRGGAAVERRWAGALRLGARVGRGS
jgi:hypothetical protein